MPSARLRQFEANIARVRSLIGIGQSITSMTSGVIDVSDMHRSALVQAVAALDAYVHGVVLDYLVEIILGRRAPGSPGKLGLPMHAVADIVAAAPIAFESELRARTHVAERLARDTYQRPDDIGNAFALVGKSKLWAGIFGSTADAEKTALGLVVDRRNRIVHACDSDPLMPGQLVALTDLDAVEAVNVVERIVRAIDSYV